MRISVLPVASLLVCALVPSSAFAQRFPFEKTLQVPPSAKLDASTVRGKIDVVPGLRGRIVVHGESTVRVGFDVPANAVDLARQVAANPPIGQTGGTVTLTNPTDRDVLRAVTISYRVEVPANTEVETTSESGATSISGIAGPVSVHTQSAAVALRNLAGSTTVTTGSGAVTAETVTGALSVETSSSAFTGTGLGSSLQLRTHSGSVEAAFTGLGDVDVQTDSSAVTLRGVRGGVTARTQSGRIEVHGTPARAWTVTTGSSSVGLNLSAGSAFELDAASRSGDVVVEGAQVSGSTSKHAVKGRVGGGGPVVHVRTGSGAIHVHVGS